MPPAVSYMCARVYIYIYIYIYASRVKRVNELGEYIKNTVYYNYSDSVLCCIVQQSCPPVYNYLPALVHLIVDI